MNKHVIRLTGVGKRYVKYDDTPMLATSLRQLHRRTHRSQLWALRGLDMEVQEGECVGVIGRNGSGKSTLLQMMSGITAPTEGHVHVEGRVAPLISVGVGFHPELSGRDNVYVNAAILGLSRAEIDRRFDDIVEFAEIESFIDTPVKFYSSGMSVRLGFATAIQATPEVLLVDEVLAVGDMAFQAKCFDRMAAIRSSGTTVIVVSHNLNAVRQLCDRAIVLHGGRKDYEGDTAEAISRLHELLQEEREVGQVRIDEPMDFEPGMLDVEDVSVVDPNGGTSNYFDSGDTVTARIRVRALQDVPRPFVTLTVMSASGVPVYTDRNRRAPYPDLTAGEVASYDVRFPARLVTGSYTLLVRLGRIDAENKVPTRLAVASPVSFYVAGRGGVQGLADLAATFE